MTDDIQRPYQRLVSTQEFYAHNRNEREKEERVRSWGLGIPAPGRRFDPRYEP